jgi:hypothetical protein
MFTAARALAKDISLGKRERWNLVEFHLSLFSLS